MTHANAPLTPEGRRRLAVLVVDKGWSLRRAAERFQCSPATAKRWADRYRVGVPLTDRSCRPRSCPGRLPRRTERRIIALRLTRRWGPHRIAYHLQLHRSTVGRVLARYGMPKLVNIDRATGLPVRKPKPVRYEVDRPGQLVHVDIKKQGRIPDGGGWRVHGKGSVQDRAAGSTRGRATRAGAAGSRGYRSHAFKDALGEAIKYKRTRPYRPQTNGKVERFNRTLATEWAYAAPYASEAEREAAYTGWLHHYNHHRPHTGIGGLTPSDRVHNLTGKYI